MKIFKVLLILLTIIGIAVICLTSIKFWISRHGIRGLWIDIRALVCLIILLSCVVGLCFRKMAGWVLTLLLLYMCIFICGWVYWQYGLRFSSPKLIHVLLLGSSIFFMNTKDIKDLFRLPGGTTVLKLNVLIIPIAALLVWYLSLSYYMNP